MEPRSKARAVTVSGQRLAEEPQERLGVIDLLHNFGVALQYLQRRLGDALQITRQAAPGLFLRRAQTEHGGPQIAAFAKSGRFF
jgi:hypothetical protein